MALKIRSMKGEGLILEVKDEYICLSGRALTSTPGVVLKPFFEEVHENIVLEKLDSIKIDIKNLAFLNSAGIKEVVNWILKLEKIRYEDRYKIIFIYEPESKWQEAFVSSMVYLNSTYVDKQSG